jgi:chromosome segregation ATPase
VKSREKSVTKHYFYQEYRPLLMSKTIKDKALEMLHNLDPWKKIRVQLGSGGSVYDALAEFMKFEAEKIYNSKKREITSLENELSNLKSSIQNLNNQKQETEKQHQSLSTSFSNLREEKNRIENELARARSTEPVKSFRD